MDAVAVRPEIYCVPFRFYPTLQKCRRLLSYFPHEFLLCPAVVGLSASFFSLVVVATVDVAASTRHGGEFGGENGNLT